MFYIKEKIIDLFDYLEDDHESIKETEDFEIDDDYIDDGFELADPC